MRRLLFEEPSQGRISPSILWYTKNKRSGSKARNLDVVAEGAVGLGEEEHLVLGIRV